MKITPNTLINLHWFLAHTYKDKFVHSCLFKISDTNDSSLEAKSIYTMDCSELETVCHALNDFFASEESTSK